MADMKKLMESLHLYVGEELLRRIETGEASSADLSVARQVLKDNGIDANANQSEPLANLAKILPFDPEETVGETG
jgi:hypothetical protein